jgi:hypothetical protein
MSPAEHKPWSVRDVDYDFGTITVTHCCDEHARAAHLAEQGAEAGREADPQPGASSIRG